MIEAECDAEQEGGVSGAEQKKRAAMHCFRFAGWDRAREADEERPAPATSSSTTAPPRSLSARSNSSTAASTDRDVRRCESELSVNDASELSSAGSFGRCRQLSLPQRPANALRVFTFQELRSATRGFSRALMLGEGGFGCVYRGAIRGGDGGRRSVVDVAIKQLGRKGLQGHKEWITEVNVLGVVDHRNLVKLIGYCAEDDERGMQLLLVYEFMPNGSLADHLSARSPRPASWATRLRVALDTARGLKYLHEESGFKVSLNRLLAQNLLQYEMPMRVAS
jgi:hypothetical protein